MSRSHKFSRPLECEARIEGRRESIPGKPYRLAGEMCYQNLGVQPGTAMILRKSGGLFLRGWNVR